jgi:group I intron endonuclease
MENEHYGVIYKITCLINKKVYIGQTKQKPKRRWWQHKKNKDNSYIGRAIIKYGEENFTFEVIDNADSLEELNLLEEKYINDLNSLSPNGYNIQQYNCGTKVISKETKIKISHYKINKKNKKSSSKYFGVCLNSNKKYWRAKVVYKSKYICLGTFFSEIDAAKARDIEVLKDKYYGIFELNFPELREKYINNEITINK